MIQIHWTPIWSSPVTSGLQVKLDYPDEFVTSIAGFFTASINSLTFRTNKRIWGPIGREEGQYFSLPSEAGKVIGFFGRSGDFLKSIGAQVELHSNKLYPFKSVGLFQSSSVSSWELYPFERLGLFRSSSVSCWDDGNQHTNVRKIIVEFDTSKWPFIRSIGFQYEGENKKLWQLEKHGGIDGNTFDIGRNVKIHTVCALAYICFVNSLRKPAEPSLAGDSFET